MFCTQHCLCTRPIFRLGTLTWFHQEVVFLFCFAFLFFFYRRTSMFFFLCTGKMVTAHKPQGVSFAKTCTKHVQAARSSCRWMLGGGNFRSGCLQVPHLFAKTHAFTLSLCDLLSFSRVTYPPPPPFLLFFPFLHLNLVISEGNCPVQMNPSSSLNYIPLLSDTPVLSCSSPSW